MDQDPRTPLILLASLSPRRRRLLSWLGVPFECASVDTPEDLDTPLASDPAALAAHLAAEKAAAARDAGLGTEMLVLTFDTIVVHEGAVLGKPKDADDARRMLRSLSGKIHQVVTAAAMLCPGDDEPSTFAVTTDVRMKPLTDARIREWMSSGEFMGCAGAYNIEGQVAEVTTQACYQNVAGLPLCHVYAALSGAGSTPGALTSCGPLLPRSPIARCDAALCRTCELGPRVTG